MKISNDLNRNILLSLAEASGDLYLALSKDFSVLFFNSSYEAYFKKKYGKKLTIGENWSWLITNDEINTASENEEWLKAFKGDSFNTILNTKEEQGESTREVSFAPIFNDQKEIIGAIQTLRKIPGQYNRESHHQKKRNFYRLANSLPQIVWSAMPDGFLDYFNDQWYAFSGMTDAISVGYGWATAIHPDDLDYLTEKWNHSLKTGNMYHVQARAKAADGSFRWLLIRALPYLNKKKEIIKWFGTCTDIEDQKKSEHQLQQMASQLKSANGEIELRNKRLTRINADLDNFIYAASHDLKSPINNIEALVTSFYEILESSSEKNQEAIQLLRFIDQSVERFKNTINDLTDVAKVQNQEVEDEENIHLELLLKEVLQSMNGLISQYKAVIGYDFSELSYLKFSRKNLRSIYYNLISNAIKYSAPERPPHVNIFIHPKKQFYELHFEDNGLGIKVEDNEKVFKIFKRLHLHVEGSGVGMAIVKRIMDNAGGKIEIESEVGRGTLFKLFFPANHE